MEIVNFLAEFWGFSLVIISLAFLTHPKHLEHIIQLMEDQKNVLIFGIINVMLGIAFVLLYNVWDSSWRVIVTILAWLIVVRGFICLFSPNLVSKGLEKVKAHRDWFSMILVALVLLGCVLIYFGQTI